MGKYVSAMDHVIVDYRGMTFLELENRQAYLGRINNFADRYGISDFEHAKILYEKEEAIYDLINDPPPSIARILNTIDTNEKNIKEIKEIIKSKYIECNLGHSTRQHNLKLGEYVLRMNLEENDYNLYRIVGFTKTYREVVLISYNTELNYKGRTTAEEWTYKGDMIQFLKGYRYLNQDKILIDYTDNLIPTHKLNKNNKLERVIQDEFINDYLCKYINVKLDELEREKDKINKRYYTDSIYNQIENMKKEMRDTNKKINMINKSSVESKVAYSLNCRKENIKERIRILEHKMNVPLKKIKYAEINMKEEVNSFVKKFMFTLLDVIKQEKEMIEDE